MFVGDNLNNYSVQLARIENGRISIPSNCVFVQVKFPVKDIVDIEKIEIQKQYLELKIN